MTFSTTHQKPFCLDDKVIVITGGAGGIGGAIAQAAARFRAKVVVLDLSISGAEAMAGAIGKIGGIVLAVQADVTNRASLEEARGRIVAEFGKIDGLVNGAGGNKNEATTSPELSFHDLSEQAVRQVWDLNFWGTFLCCQVFGKEMACRGSGSIVNIASIAGFRPLTRTVAYSAAKAAVINLSQWLGVYFCRDHAAKIRVNALAPGFCATEQNQYLLFNPSGELTDRGRTILSMVPQNRFGQPEELSDVALWLLSDAASFVTGSVITIDGGYSAFGGV